MQEIKEWADTDMSLFYFITLLISNGNKIDSIAITKYDSFRLASKAIIITSPMVDQSVTENKTGIYL